MNKTHGRRDLIHGMGVARLEGATPGGPQDRQRTTEVTTMRRAILFLAFLASFENYNTTTFAILADKTLVTVLAGQVRQGTTPALSV